MDDAVALVKTKEEAINNLEKIRLFAKEKLKLELNNKTQIFKSKQGINFCGYKINEFRLKIRDRGKRKLKNKVKYLKKKIKQGELTSKEASRYLAGHLGYINIANTYNLENKLFFKAQFMGANQKANSTNNRANRGGNYNNNGSNNPASNRNNNNPDNSSNNNIASRASL